MIKTSLIALIIINATTTTYPYNAGNQLTQETTGARLTTYGYDKNGNQITKIIGPNTWTYGYDYDNQLNSYDDPIINANDAKYINCPACMGKRMVKTVGRRTTKFFYDGDDCIAEYFPTNRLLLILGQSLLYYFF